MQSKVVQLHRNRIRTRAAGFKLSWSQKELPASPFCRAYSSPPPRLRPSVPPPPPCQAVGESELVFFGTVMIAQPSNRRMDVDRSFKGDLPQSVELFDSGICDGPNLQVGNKYLMYTSGSHSEPLASRGSRSHFRAM
jgi:hypothetical protein